MRMISANGDVDSETKRRNKMETDSEGDSNVEWLWMSEFSYFHIFFSYLVTLLAQNVNSWHPEYETQ